MKTRVFIILLSCLSAVAGAQQPEWTWLGPARPPLFEGRGMCPNGVGLVSAVYIDPLNPELILAGSNTGGLFMTRDYGRSWKNVTDNDLPLVVGISSIVRDPLNPLRYYIGTGTSSYNREYGLGVWTSGDGGESWQPTGLEFRPDEPGGVRASVKKILLHPAGTGMMMALLKTADGAAVYRSHDKGRNWERVLEKEGEFFFDAEFDPGDPQTIYLGGHSLWISRDGGSTWDRSAMEAPEGEIIHRVAISVHPGFSGKVWALYETGGKRGIVLAASGDAGKNWRTISTKAYSELTVGQWKMEFEVSRIDTSIFFAGGVFMHRSIDGGKTFIRISEARMGTPAWMHVDIRTMLVFPGNDRDVIYCGHDGGLSVSGDGGNSWLDLSGTGLGITQFWGIALDPASSTIYGGTQDLGVQVFDTNGWRNAGIYGDAYDGLVVDGKGDTVLEFINSGIRGITRSTDGGRQWRSLPHPMKGGSNDRPVALGPGNNAKVYSGYHDVWSSADAGKSWEKISRFSSDFGVPEWASLSALCVAQSKPLTICAAYGGPAWRDEADGKLFRTDDGGLSWKDISGTLPGIRWAGITDIAISPADADEIWVSVDGFWADENQAYKVFRSMDGGRSWENVSTGMPNYPVNCLLLPPSSGFAIAGTDAGAFYLEKGSGTWSPLGTGLPSCIVSDLEYDTQRKLVYASTFGRGLYRIPLEEMTRTMDRGMDKDPKAGSSRRWIFFRKRR